MAADTHDLASLLTLVALIAATIQYIELIKRRAQLREAQELALLRATGVRRLARMLLDDRRARRSAQPRLVTSRSSAR